MNALRALHSLITADTLRIRNQEQYNNHHPNLNNYQQQDEENIKESRKEDKKRRVVRFSDEIVSPNEKIILFDDASLVQPRATTPMPNAVDQYDNSYINSIPSDTYTSAITSNSTISSLSSSTKTGTVTTTTTTTKTTTTLLSSTEINPLSESQKKDTPLSITENIDISEENNPTLQKSFPEEITQTSNISVLNLTENNEENKENILNGTIHNKIKDTNSAGSFNNNNNNNNSLQLLFSTENIASSSSLPHTSQIARENLGKQLISPLLISKLEDTLSAIIMSFQNEVIESHNKKVNSSEDTSHENKDKTTIELEENKVEIIDINKDDDNNMNDIVSNKEITINENNNDDDIYEFRGSLDPDDIDQLKTPISNNNIKNSDRKRRNKTFSSPIKGNSRLNKKVPKNNTPDFDIIRYRDDKSLKKDKEKRRNRKSSINESISLMKLKGELKYYRTIKPRRKQTFPKDIKGWNLEKDKRPSHWLTNKRSSAIKRATRHISYKRSLL